MKVQVVVLGIFTICMGFAQEVGITLFEHSDFRGRQESFTADEPDLRDSIIGFRQASSVSVPSGWSVTLYADVNFRGQSLVLDKDLANMSKTDFGNDRVGSIQVQSPSGQGKLEKGPKVVLYDQEGFQGRSESSTIDLPHFKNSIIGNDRLRSLKVSNGVKVTLFEHGSYGGRAEVFLTDDDDLSDNTIGNDSVSSVKIEIFDVTAFGFLPQPVTLFDHDNYQGDSEPFFMDDPDLRDNLIGKNHASSIKIPPGTVLTLYGRADYKGKSLELRGDLWDLGQTKLGNDHSGSLKIRFEGAVTRMTTPRKAAPRQAAPRKAAPRQTAPPKSITKNVTKSKQTHSPPPKVKKNTSTNTTEGRPNKTSTAPGPVSTGKDTKVAVILFSGRYYGGKSEELSASDANLADNAIGKLGSIKISAGFKVTLFEQKNFTGKSETLTFDDMNLSDNVVGAQSVLSIRIEPASL